MDDVAWKQNLTMYPRSLREDAFMARDARGEDVLVVGGAARPLDGEAAAYLRQRFPFTAPAPVLGRPRTFGVGDRLGLACPGHIRVFSRFDATPVFAQQSVRELTLTGRTFRDVLDCVTFAVFREGFTGGYGADGDHLKRPEDVAEALALGYTMITLDCSDHIGAGGPPEAELRDLYLGRAFEVGEGVTLSFDEDSLAEASRVYGAAVGFAASVWDRFFASGEGADFEISIDETQTPTKPAQHFFVAHELIRRGVRFATMAPRFCGEFQKGIDYKGDLARFDREMAAHAAIARHFGYKLSIHSGSDKFSVFPAIARHARGAFHVKTAGTNWLEAMRVVAQRDPALYRLAHARALAAFPEATTYYHVTTDLCRIPSLDSLADGDLPALFDNPHSRQLIHITYGQLLRDPDLRPRLFALWRNRAEDYARALDRHIGAHLKALAVPEA